MDTRMTQEDMNKKFNEMVDNARFAYRDLKRMFERKSDRIEWYVRSNPRKAVLLSIGAGILLGMITKACRRKRF